MLSTAVVFNWRSATSKKGLYPLHIRLTLGGKSRYWRVPLPAKLKPADWRGDYCQWVHQTFPDAPLINRYLYGLVALVDDYAKRCRYAGQPLCFDSLLDALNRTPGVIPTPAATTPQAPVSFNAYFETIITHPPEDVHYPMKRYRTALAALNRFRVGIPFAALNPALLAELVAFLQQEETRSASTIAGYISVYHNVIRWARAAGYITEEAERLLFPNMRLPGTAKGKYHPSEENYLSLEEVIAMAQLEGLTGSLLKARDSFLLQVYLGVSYRELRQLPQTIQKQPRAIASPAGSLLDQGRILIESYRSQNGASPYLLDHSLFMAEPTYNRTLKQLAHRLCWQRTLSSKMARLTHERLLKQGALFVTVILNFNH